MLYIIIPIIKYKNPKNKQTNRLYKQSEVRPILRIILTDFSPYVKGMILLNTIAKLGNISIEKYAPLNKIVIKEIISDKT